MIIYLSIYLSIYLYIYIYIYIIYVQMLYVCNEQREREREREREVVFVTQTLGREREVLFVLGQAYLVGETTNDSDWLVSDAVTDE